MPGSTTRTDSWLSEVGAFVRTDVEGYLASHPEDRYPDVLVERLRQLGVFGVTVPEEYGGSERPAREVARLGYELGRGWQSLAALVGTHLKLCRQVLAHGTEQQRRQWLPLMAGGERVFARAFHEQGVTDPAALRSTAELHGGTGRLNGHKSWVTNARHADVIVAVVRSGAATIGVLTDPRRPGVEIGAELPRPGMLGVSLAEVTYQDYEFDPDTEVIGGAGHDLTEALRGYDVTSYVARALGSADAVYECALRFVRESAPGRPPRAGGAIGLRVGELATRRAAMHAVWQCLVQPTEGGHPPLTSGAAKVITTAALQELVRAAAVLCGGAGYAGPLACLGRHYRDALALPIIGTPNDTLLSLIGERELAGEDA
ncbi:acyl-CoA dehydrogenase family protein [Kitasatospora sp. NPDC051170]|uniref:acyl-CoA dehydrogenase family protein n=1 Tax=Kitasatospora sp. NPDC051170 TaxID=3364056 RepID=UPI0037BB50E2